MLLLNKLLIQQKNILLAPGNYFHDEFSHPIYHQLPMQLKQQHNQRLIEQYNLAMPNRHTRKLPSVLSEYWEQLPTVAVTLSHLWQVKTPTQYEEMPSLRTPLEFSAFGAAQILAHLAPFGQIYTLRAKYMFSQKTQQIIPTYLKVTLPWNFIEEACQHIARNKN